MDKDFEKKLKNLLASGDELCLSKIQRYLEFGFSKAMSFVDYLEEQKVIEKIDGQKFWKILDKEKFIKLSIKFENDK